MNMPGLVSCIGGWQHLYWCFDVVYILSQAWVGENALKRRFESYG